MFEEDHQWNLGSPDTNEEDLHSELFGDISENEPGSLSSSSKKKKKRKRTQQEREHLVKKPRDEVPGEEIDTPEDEETTLVENRSLSKEHPQPLHVNGIEDDATPSRGPSSLPLERKHPRGMMSSKLYSRMSSQLEGSRFRMINQQLYSSTGAEAKSLFDQDPHMFDVYHRGFAAQVAKWPENPIDRIISHVQSLSEDTVVCDFGCGEAKLAESVRQRVYSFDLVAINERVTECDMAHVPLKRHTVDLCVFCLSLMGTNVSEFIREARRVVRKGGEMRICEVSSRFSSFDQFVDDVEKFGFRLESMEEFSKMFVEFIFTAVGKPDSELPQITLKPCVYKKR